MASARSSSALSNGAKQFNERTEKRADQRKYILLLLGLRNDNPCILFLLKYGWLYKLRLVYITNFCEDRTFSLHMIKASFVILIYFYIMYIHLIEVPFNFHSYVLKYVCK